MYVYICTEKPLPNGNIHHMKLQAAVRCVGALVFPIFQYRACTRNTDVECGSDTVFHEIYWKRGEPAAAGSVEHAKNWQSSHDT